MGRYAPDEGQHLPLMAIQTDFEVKVIDPRPIFAISEGFPEIRLAHDWSDIALSDVDLDSKTTLVALTLDPKIYDTALHKVLGKSLFHTACIGSRRTHVERLKWLPKAGFSNAETTKIEGPAGLNIEAKTPAEVAVSVLGEFFAAYICRAPR